jgi:hypothetical protein
VTLSAFGQEIDLSQFARRLVAIAKAIDRGLRAAIVRAQDPGPSTSPGGSDFIIAAIFERQPPSKASEPPTID